MKCTESLCKYTFDNQTPVFELAIRQRSKDLKHLIPRTGLQVLHICFKYAKVGVLMHTYAILVTEVNKYLIFTPNYIL